MADCTFHPTPDQPLPGPQLDPLCNMGTAIKGVVGDAAEDTQKAITTWMGEALGWMIKVVTTSWVRISGPSMVNGDPTKTTESTGTIAFLHQSFIYAASIIFILAAITGLVMMGTTHKAQPGIEILKMLVRFVFIATSGSALIGMFIVACDGLGLWMLDRATSGEDFATAMGRMVVNSGGLVFFVFIVLGFLALLVMILQVAVLYFRWGVLIFLVGIWFVPAAMSNTEKGKQVFGIITGWIFAAGIYQLVASALYAAAFKLMSEQPTAGDEAKTAAHIAGMTLMTLCIVALPATMRVAAPPVSAVASGKGFGAMAGAAVMTVASGAIAAGAFSGAGGAAAASTAGSTGGEQTPSGSGPDSGNSGGGKPPPNGSDGGEWEFDNHIPQDIPAPDYNL